MLTSPHGAVLTDLVRTRGTALLRLAYQLAHNQVAAQDLLQESLASYLTHIESGGATILHREAYLRTIIVHTYTKTRKGVFQLDIFTERHWPQHVTGVDEQVIEREVLWQWLSTLSARQRTVLVLRFYLELGDVEIAQTLECSPGTVRSTGHRAIKSLRRSQSETERRTDMIP